MPKRNQRPTDLLIESGSGQIGTPNEQGRFVLQLITPGWGTSGYYSPQVLEATAKSGVFKAGTKTYLDHPGEQETYDRATVGRSIRDLAGILAEDARWDPAYGASGALVAEAQVFGPYREVLTEMKDAIGVSIRATAAVEAGEAEGRQGVIVTELVKALSADYVTAAGRGGRILQVLESALTTAEATFTPAASLVKLTESRNVGQWIESRMHLDFTQQADDMFGDGRLSREERIAMSGAVGDALDAFTTSLEASAPQLYTRDLWEDPQVIADTIEAAFTKADAGVANTVKCKTCGHMASAHADVKAGDNMGACSMKGCDCKAMATPAAKESAAPTTPVIPAGKKKEINMPQIEVDEAEYGRITEAAGRVSALEAERDLARTELASSRARDTARPIATQLVGASESLPPMVATRVIEAAVAGVTVGENGFDEAVFRTAVEAARTAAETEVAQIAEALGVGKVVNFGHTSSTNQGEVSEADLDAILADAFGRTVKEA